MDDVAALCPRVIVIDKGALSFDGELEDLVAACGPRSGSRLRFSAPVPREQVAELGTRGEARAGGSGAAGAAGLDERLPSAAALATLPVVDLTVEDPPLEEVMSELFSRSRAAPGARRRETLRYACAPSPPSCASGFAEAVAYRAEMLVWMLRHHHAARHAGALDRGGRGGAGDGAGGSPGAAASSSPTSSTVFVVRQLITAWVVVGDELRGPPGPALDAPARGRCTRCSSYATENLASLPMRAVVTLPVLAILLRHRR